MTELVEEISKGANPHIKPVELSRGRYGGTYVVEDLALTYAMWISPRFHLEVLRGFKESRGNQATDLGDTIVPAGAPLVAAKPAPYPDVLDITGNVGGRSLPGLR